MEIREKEHRNNKDSFIALALCLSSVVTIFAGMFLLLD